MEEGCNACIFEIYQDQKRFNRYYCKVIAGRFGFSGMTPAFIPVEQIYDLPLNGSGKNKAEKKIRAKLKSDGLELMVIKDTSKLVIVDRK